METRNTPVLREIIAVLSTDLDDAPATLDRLENHFQHRLLVIVGDIYTVSAQAEQLRLRITADECSVVLDHIAATNAVTITVDHVETVINELFEDRFIEP